MIDHVKSYLSSLPALLPIATAWAEKQEAVALDQGEPLTESQLADAILAGVAHPEKIRVVCVEELPHPDNEEIMFMARQIGLFGPKAHGETLGYGVYLRRGEEDRRYTFVHECVHVSQYEKKAGIGPFLNDYLRECIDPRFPFGILEKEAIYVARHICHKSSDVKQLKTGPLANLDGVPAT